MEVSIVTLVTSYRGAVDAPGSHEQDAGGTAVQWATIAVPLKEVQELNEFAWVTMVVVDGVSILVVRLPAYAVTKRAPPATMAVAPTGPSRGKLPSVGS